MILHTSRLCVSSLPLLWFVRVILQAGHAQQASMGPAVVWAGCGSMRRSAGMNCMEFSHSFFFFWFMPGAFAVIGCSLFHFRCDILNAAIPLFPFLLIGFDHLLSSLPLSSFLLFQLLVGFCLHQTQQTRSHKLHQQALVHPRFGEDVSQILLSIDPTNFCMGCLTVSLNNAPSIAILLSLLVLVLSLCRYNRKRIESQSHRPVSSAPRCDPSAWDLVLHEAPRLKGLPASLLLPQLLKGVKLQLLKYSGKPSSSAKSEKLKGWPEPLFLPGSLCWQGKGNSYQLTGAAWCCRFLAPFACPASAMWIKTASSKSSIFAENLQLCSLNFAPLSCALKTKTKPIAIKVTQRLFHKYTNVSQTFRALSLKSLQTTSNASTHTLFLSLGLEPTNVVGCSVQILFKGDKNQGGVFV